MMTCLEIGREVRYSLHDVFRALPFVPEMFYLFLEFASEEMLRFFIRVVSVDGSSSYATDVYEVQPLASGFSTRMGELPGQVAGLLPGTHNVQAVEAESVRQVPGSTLHAFASASRLQASILLRTNHENSLETRPTLSHCRNGTSPGPRRFRAGLRPAAAQYPGRAGNRGLSRGR